MATIGTFTQSDDGAYVGAIKTLTLNVKQARFVKVASESEKGPDFRIFSGATEFGAAWLRTSRDEREYLSVKLDDPSFVSPIYATLVAGDEGHSLIWSRARSAD
jgi:uncharacterized protein (DUF736 family)